MADYKSDMQFLLWQLSLLEHNQDREEIAAVAKRHGIAHPIFDDPRAKPPRLKAKDRRRVG